jgi:hypothetical protein
VYVIGGIVDRNRYTVSELGSSDAWHDNLSFMEPDLHGYPTSPAAFHNGGPLTPVFMREQSQKPRYSHCSTPHWDLSSKSTN